MPSSIMPLTGTLTREMISAASESIDTSIAAISMPFEAELSQYVKADESEINTLAADIKAMLANVKALNVQMATLLLNTADYDTDGYTWGATVGLSTIISGMFTAPEAILSGISRASLLLDPSDFAENYTPSLDSLLSAYASGSSLTADDDTGATVKGFGNGTGLPANVITTLMDTYAAGTALAADTDLAAVLKAHAQGTGLPLEVATTIMSTYAEGSGTGLPAATETALMNRYRSRILYEANRNARRIITDISKRVPYAGQIADELQMADRGTVISLSDAADKILEEQARLTYQSVMDRVKTSGELAKLTYQGCIDRIKSALDYLRMSLENNMDRMKMSDRIAALNYMAVIDRVKMALDYTKMSLDNNINRMKTALDYERTMIEKYDSEKKRLLQAYTSADEIQLKKHSVYLDEARLTFENRRAAIDGAINLDGLTSKHEGEFKDRKLRAYTAYDDLQLRNTFQYYEYLMKVSLSFVESAIDFALKMASGPDQITFQNYLAMAKILADGQLRIGALVGDMTPTVQTLTAP